VLSITPNALSTAQEPLNWTVRELFASPVARISLLRCRPDTLKCSCEKCAVDNQLVFVKRGGFIKHRGKTAQVVNANKAAFFRAGECYKTSHVDPGGDACIVFSFSDHVVPRRLLDTLPGDAACAAVTPAVVGHALRVAADPLSEPMAVEESAIALLERALPATPQSASARGPARAVIRDIEAALTADPSAKWSLAGLSRQFRRNPFYVSRSFRATTGFPLHRYLLNLRLASAAARLTDGEENLAALAFDLGFSSHSHFSAAFRASLGMSPRQFRRVAQGRPADRRAELIKKLKAPKILRP